MHKVIHSKKFLKYFLRAYMHKKFDLYELYEYTNNGDDEDTSLKSSCLERERKVKGSYKKFNGTTSELL